jgi:CMD domain protein
MTTDIIDDLVGVALNSEVDGLRRRRDQARLNSQASYDALFTEQDQTGVSLSERLAVATFVAGVHGESLVRDHYRRLLVGAAGAELADLIAAVAAAGATQGPYGAYPATTELRDEDAAGLVFHIDSAAANELGERLTAAIVHAHLLVFRPRESTRQALAALLSAGWSTAEIVTLAQLVAFLSFQLRVVHGLRVLKESQA